MAINCKSKCDHNKILQQCSDCREDLIKIGAKSNICEHGIQKNNCKEDICKSSCSPCVCIHNVRRHSCKICNPITCQFCNKIYPKSYIKKHLSTCKMIPSSDSEEDEITPNDSASNV
jgi:hypothetical protein